MNLLIIGHARHGKDTLAEYLSARLGVSYMDSSKAASEIFLFDVLKDKYGYKTREECYLDRVNHRAEWFDLICGYNKEDPAKLAKGIMERSDIYVGMRSDREIEECVRIGLFDAVVGVYDPRKPEEPRDSFDIDLWRQSDIVIPNAGSLHDLYDKIDRVVAPFLLTLKKRDSVRRT